MKARWIVSAAAAASLMVGVSTVSADEALAKASGCFACHSIEKKVLGPGWKDVAAKYAGDKAAGKALLLTKVAKGGKGAWADQGPAGDQGARRRKGQCRLCDIFRYVFRLARQPR